MNYYNDIDPFCCAWIKELISAGLIPPGDVDDRSIADVKATDLAGYTQCHFFCGIAGWPYALSLAAWPATRPVWTGSCPCQPLSVAGLGKGSEDERHLWPEFARLIGECRPPTVFGEQVASKLGREWLAGIRLDLEQMGYAVGAADLCAASVGAPHIRQRLFWVADSKGKQPGEVQPKRNRRASPEPCDNGTVSRVAHPMPTGRPEGWTESGIGQAADSGSDGRMADAECDGRRADEPRRGSEGRTANGRDNPWVASVLIPCADGKARRVPLEPAFFPLVAGLSPGRVGILRGAGNAIVPQVAAEFVKAFMAVTD